MDNKNIQPNSPYTLFLILILLILATSPDIEEKLNYFANLLGATTDSVKIFKGGVQSFHTAMMSAAGKG